MRKMTKTAVTLAAMSAMTIASASLAFAAAQRDQLNAVENPAATSNPNSGKWEGNNADGWTFTPADEKKLANTWAEIDGVWYYFHKDGIMARDELVYMEGETYYFTPTGAMAVGWYGFDNDSDVIYNYELNIEDNIADINNPVFKNAADAYDTVWMYFYSDGKAADDEWVNPGFDLWYYFDDIVMACGDYDHEIGNAYYGFAEDGHMFVGWEENSENYHIKVPDKNESTWYYYDVNGKKFNVNAENNGYGWKKIAGKWYCFREEDSGDAHSVGTLITNTYFNNKATADTSEDADPSKDPEYYYVDSNGLMATGVVSVSKEAYYVTAVSGWNANHRKKLKDCGGDTWDVLFNSNGTAKEGWSETRYYASMNPNNVLGFDKEDYIVEPYAEKGKVLKGALVKNAFISKSSNLYYVDKYGDKMVNHALQVGAADVTKTNGNITGLSTFVADDIDNSNPYKAYILFNSKGEAYSDIEVGREIRIGSKKYTAVGTYTEISSIKDYSKLNVTLFIYDNKN